MLIPNYHQDIQEHCPHCSRTVCQTINIPQIIPEKNKIDQKKPTSVIQQSQSEQSDRAAECQRFVFSFYVKINRDLTEEENLNDIKFQLENLEEIENLSLIYFKKYFNRLLFNEVVIDFKSDFSNSEIWSKAPRSVLRKISNYNDAYKFSQLNIGKA